MKRLAILLLIAAAACYAQDYPRLELAAGYGYGSVDTQGYGTQRNAQGWSGAAATNIFKWVGLEFGVNGSYNTLDYDFQGNSLRTNAWYYSFLTGPKFTYRKGKMVPFVHALFGVDRVPAFGNTVYDPVTATSTTPFVSGFASAAGGGIDYKLSRRLWFRSQADYLYSNHGYLIAPTNNNFRVQAALVFTFGDRLTDDAKRRKASTVMNASAKAPESPTAPATAKPNAAEEAKPFDEPTTLAESTAPEPEPTAPVVNAGSVAPAMVTTVPYQPAQPVLKAQAPAAQPATVQPGSAQVVRASTTSTTIASTPNSVVISDGGTTTYQSSQQQESLGDIARRYRKAKHPNDAAGN